MSTDLGDTGFPMGDPHCPECRGEGVYRGLTKVEPCRSCSPDSDMPPGAVGYERKRAKLDDALDFMDAAEEISPGIFENNPNKPDTEILQDGDALTFDPYGPRPRDLDPIPVDASEFRVVRTPTRCGFAGGMRVGPDELITPRSLSMKELNRFFAEYWRDWERLHTYSVIRENGAS